MKRLVEEIGQIFTCEKVFYICKGFENHLGLKTFDTAKEAIENATEKSKIIGVLNHKGGMCDLDKSFLVKKMPKPLPEKYGYQAPGNGHEESGWLIEGGEEAYYELLYIWEHFEE